MSVCQVKLGKQVALAMACGQDLVWHSASNGGAARGWTGGFKFGTKPKKNTYELQNCNTQMKRDLDHGVTVSWILWLDDLTNEKDSKYPNHLQSVHLIWEQLH